MAVPLDFIFRPLEATTQDAPNRRPSNPGSGEEFAGLLSGDRKSKAESGENGPREPLLSAAMVPPLPVDAGQMQYPELAPNDLSSSLAAPTDTAKLAIPAIDLAKTGLPGVDTSELVTSRQLEQAISGAVEANRTLKDGRDLEPLASRVPAEMVAEGAADEPEADRRPPVEGVLEHIASTSPIDAGARATVGELEPDLELPILREEARQAAPALLAASRTSETADFGSAAEPDGRKSSASGSIDIPPSGVQFAPSGLSRSEVVGALDAKSPRAGNPPSAEEAIDGLEQSDIRDVAANVPSAAISSLNVVPGSPVFGEGRLRSAQTSAATSPAIASRMTEKPSGSKELDHPSISPAPVSAVFEVPDLTSAREGPGSGDTGGLSTQGTSAMAVAGAAPAAVHLNSVTATAPTVMSPSNAVLAASPAEVVSIVSSAADNGESDRIVIQLDPPELGRVSIDFKFDANGLQHVTVTGESPEAVRQLRLMHFELTQALERHGITSQNMTFQQHQQNPQQSPAPNAFARQVLLSDAGGASTLDPLIANISQTSPRTMPGGRLDMKL